MLVIWIPKRLPTGAYINTTHLGFPRASGFNACRAFLTRLWSDWSVPNLRALAARGRFPELRPPRSPISSFTSPRRLKPSKPPDVTRETLAQPHYRSSSRSGRCVTVQLHLAAASGVHGQNNRHRE